MLALVDLSGKGERSIEQLSGGEQQRVALARALAPRPRLLMLDEPLGALDRALRERLMLELRQILKQVGVTAVYVTHDQTEAFAIADRIVVMKPGAKSSKAITPQAIYDQPRTPFVAKFLGFHNLLSGVVVSRNGVETEIGRLRLNYSLSAIGTQVTVLIKPDAASFIQTSEFVRSVTSLQTSEVSTVEGIVTAVSFRGRYTQIQIQIKQPHPPL